MTIRGRSVVVWHYSATPDLAERANEQTVSTVDNSSGKKKKMRMGMRMSGGTKHLGVRGHSMGPAPEQESEQGLSRQSPLTFAKSSDFCTPSNVAHDANKIS